MLRPHSFLLWVVAAGFLVGCLGTSPAARYYLLDPLPADESVQTPAEFETGLMLGIGPVLLPDYLERQQIVTRKNDHAVRLAEFDRWAEPLKQNFIRVLKENLAMLTGTDYVLMEPWPKAADIEYRLVVEVIRFEVDAQKEATLTTRWVLIREDDDVVLLTRRSTHTAIAEGSDYGRIVAALNRVLADFSREAADQIQRVYLKEHGR
jgi:uncharacterized lipoprotein YmbA